MIRRNVRRRNLMRRVTAQPIDQAVAPRSEADLDDLLAALTSDRRQAFVLTQMLGLSYDEAAEVCGCPVGTIRSRVARGARPARRSPRRRERRRQRLSEAWTGRGGELLRDQCRHRT